VSFNTWTPHAVSSEAFNWEGSAWRIVEAQHVASTMKVIDTSDEQTLLEALLDGNKPVYALGTDHLDYLLATPFRYPSRKGGSRFRGENDLGVFYAAESVNTAAAEMGYWRWKFLKDAPDLDQIEPVAHTAFQIFAKTTVIDLRREPFAANAAWLHKTDYGPTQALAGAAREAQVGAILYRSVRNPEPSWCAAILTPEAFSEAKPSPATQTWWLAVKQDEVIWRRDRESITFKADFWT
jgi:hypothetical protein